MTDQIYAFTGHRPQRLGGYGDDVTDRLSQFAEKWLTINRPAKAISGMAQGWDVAVAEAALRLNIPLIAALPFKDQDKIWPAQARVRYRAILAAADETHIVSEGDYVVWKMHHRNRWMADRCDLIVSLWDGTPEGGTAKCVEYARLIGRPVTNLWTEYLTFVDNFGKGCIP